MECVSETSQIQHLVFFDEIHHLSEDNFLYNHPELHRPNNLLEHVIHYLVMLDKAKWWMICKCGIGFKFSSYLCSNVSNF